MGQQYRLRLLEMGITGHHDFDFLLGRFYQPLFQITHKLQQGFGLFPQVEANIEGDLVVAAPTRMKFFPRLSDLDGQGLLNGHVDVFVTLVKAEAS